MTLFPFARLRHRAPASCLAIAFPILLLSQCAKAPAPGSAKPAAAKPKITTPKSQINAGSIPLIPAAGEKTTGTPPQGWTVRFLDWSTGAPEPFLAVGPGRIFFFHYMSTGQTDPPIKALMTCAIDAPAGDYVLTGTYELDGNEPAIGVRQNATTILKKLGRAIKKRSISVPVRVGPERTVEFRLTGEGSFWGTFQDLRLEPAAH